MGQFFDEPQVSEWVAQLQRPVVDPPCSPDAGKEVNLRLGAPRASPLVPHDACPINSVEFLVERVSVLRAREGKALAVVPSQGVLPRCGEDEPVGLT